MSSLFKQKRTQPVLVIGQDRSITKTRKEIFGQWLRDENNMQAWFIMRQLFTNLRLGKRERGLVLDERFAPPLNPYSHCTKDEFTEITDMDRNTELAFNNTAGQAEKESRQNVMAWGITACLSMFGFTILVLALLVASGRMG